MLRMRKGRSWLVILLGGRIVPLFIFFHLAGGSELQEQSALPAQEKKINARQRVLIIAAATVAAIVICGGSVCCLWRSWARDFSQPLPNSDAVHEVTSDIFGGDDNPAERPVFPIFRRLRQEASVAVSEVSTADEGYLELAVPESQQGTRVVSDENPATPESQRGAPVFLDRVIHCPESVADQTVEFVHYGEPEQIVQAEQKKRCAIEGEEEALWMTRLFF